MGSHDLTRRQFISLTSTGIFGLALYPFSEVEAYSFASLLASLGDFAACVGSRIVAKQMEEYISRIGKGELRNQITRANADLAAQGFADTSQSAVRLVNNNIYYPLVYDRCECLHFAAPFFDTTCGCAPITFIEGGHMTGLALVAQELRSQNVRQKDLRKVLVPKKGREIAKGNRVEGYKTPLVYKSELATVCADYKPKTEKSGRVIVEAASNTNGKLLFGREYDVRYA